MSRFIRFSYFIFLGECEMNLNKFARGDCSWQESGMFYSASWGDKRGSVIMIAIGHASILSLPRARNAILSPGARGSLTSAIDRARGNSRRRSLFPSSSAAARSGAHRAAKGWQDSHDAQTALELYGRRLPSSGCLSVCLYDLAHSYYIKPWIVKINVFVFRVIIVRLTKPIKYCYLK